MSAHKQLKKTEINPADFISAAQTIPTGNAAGLVINTAWTSAGTYLKWAHRGLSEGDDYGISNALTYAKRAACCRIDQLLLNYHAYCLLGTNYPQKADALRKIGVSVPEVIQELIINPRNKQEHAYDQPRRDVAHHAIGIAELFLAATDSAASNGAIIIFQINMQFAAGVGKNGEIATFNGWAKGTGPMIFLDVFGETKSAKIIDGTAGEARYAILERFKPAEAIELGRILHSHYSLTNRGCCMFTEFFYRQIQIQAGF